MRARRSIVWPVCVVAMLGLFRAAEAAVIGYHDISDPVKSAGWACATDSPKPIRVHLYAQTSSGMKRLDSQWADQRRDDLQGLCAGTRHAFRFADYAATPEGAELYRMREPVLIHIFADSRGGLIPVNGSPRTVSFAAAGLWDPGLKSGRWRTDYDNPAEGTAVAPLLLGQCTFTTPLSDGYFAFSGGGFDADTGCRYGEAVFPRSNAASSDGTWPARSFWAVIANVEDALW